MVSLSSHPTNAPRLHVRLTVFILRDVKELQRSYTCAAHQKERDILDVLNLPLIGVLRPHTAHHQVRKRYKRRD